MKTKSISLAKKIIEANQYLTLSTIKGNKSWCSTLTYAFDDDWKLYFMSDPNSRHIREFKDTSYVSATIFDSHQSWGHGLGLQITGEVRKVNSEDMQRVSKLFFSRVYPFGGVPADTNQFKDAIVDGFYFFYCLTLNDIWVSDPDAEVDGRLLVSL